MSSITLNMNIAALAASRRLHQASDDVSVSFSKLSTGLRINKAVDDPAGLGIAETLRADSRIAAQGLRNISDGVSLYDIAGSSLDNLTSILDRISELAVQSANGANTHEQRVALDREAQALSREFTRIAQSTSFNGKSLLNGDTEQVSIAAGDVNSLINGGVGGAIGTGEFEAAQAVGTITPPNNGGYDVGDVNGDGHLDYLSGSKGSGVSILLGNGDGTFESEVNLYNGDDSLDVEFGDFNGDGFLDILRATDQTGDREITVNLGNGDGTFGGSVTSLSSVDISSFEVADFNRDGIDDLLVRASGGEEILLGNGDGSFRSKTVSNGLSSIIGDFNDDGVVDMASVVSGTPTSFQLRFGNGDGTFNLGTSYSVTGNILGIFVADLDNDGSDDLVVNGTNTNSFINDGTGVFQFANESSSFLGTSLKDVNGDGKADMLAGVGGVYLGNGDGTFGASVFTTTSLLGDLVDIDEDGVLDYLRNNLGTLEFYKGVSKEGTGALESFSLRTQSGAKQAIPRLRLRRELISQQKGEIGAEQSRLSFAFANLQNTEITTQAAESRIRDADVAEESARLIAAQTIQQAAAQVLRQATIQTEIALQLLSFD